MFRKSILTLTSLALLAGCYQPERNCKAFRNGTFRSKAIIDGEEKTTEFSRQEDLAIESFEGAVDSFAVRWLNDCEYVLRSLNPQNRLEEESVHIKILSTTENSYTFEFGFLGEKQKFKGTAIKIH